MGLFICAKCHCVESTALGWWWSRNIIKLVLPPEMKEFESGKGLCSECLPENAKFTDGNLVGAKGKWHDKFPKVDYEKWKNTEEGNHYEKYANGYLQYINK